MLLRRFGFIGSRPHLPFHPFPFTHLCFLFSFMSSCLHVWSSHPFLRLPRTLVPALVCTCTSTYILTQVSGRPGLYNEVGFIGCPCALGSPFISTTRTFVPSRPPVMSSFFCLLCAHTYTFALTLALRLPSGRRVCVCAPCSHRVSFDFFRFVLSRGTQHFTGTVSNEATSEMGYPAWPAGRTCEF